MKNDKIDVSQLHPQGVLEQFKELCAKELNQFLDTEKGEIKKEYQEIVNCPLCGSDNSQYLYTINCFRYVQCLNCEMNFVNPRLDSAKVTDRHFSESYNFMFDNLLMKNFEYRVNSISQKKVNKVNELIPTKGKMLDIGCGAGDFMVAARKSGWDVVGVEMNEKAYNYGTRELNLEIHKELEKREFKECFDVITLWGVIEHLKYPVKTIKLCHEYLKNGGMLVIETHNPNSLTAQYQIENPDCVDRIMEGDKHILNFTIKTLRLLMEKTHFGISYWDSLGLDIVTILRYIKNATPGLINTAVYQHFDKYANEHQSTIDSLGVGDHLRIFAHKI